MTRPQMYSYSGYKITVRGEGDVDVFDARFPRNPSLYKTTSIDRAAKWIDAYRAGELWAVQDALPRKEG